jgi:hypothetical protein
LRRGISDFLVDERLAGKTMSVLPALPQIRHRSFAILLQDNLEALRLVHLLISYGKTGGNPDLVVLDANDVSGSLRVWKKVGREKVNAMRALS